MSAKKDSKANKALLMDFIFEQSHEDPGLSKVDEFLDSMTPSTSRVKSVENFLAGGEISSGALHYLLKSLAYKQEFNALLVAIEKSNYDLALHNSDVIITALSRVRALHEFQLLTSMVEQDFPQIIQSVVNGITQSRALMLGENALTGRLFEYFMALYGSHIKDPGLLLIGAVRRGDLSQLQQIMRSAHYSMRRELLDEEVWIAFWHEVICCENVSLLSYMSSIPYFGFSALLRSDREQRKAGGELSSLYRSIAIRLSSDPGEPSDNEGSQLLITEFSRLMDEEQFYELMAILMQLPVSSFDRLAVSVYWVKKLFDARPSYTVKMMTLALRHQHLWLAEYIVSSGRLTFLDSLSILKSSYRVIGSHKARGFLEKLMRSYLYAEARVLRVFSGLFERLYGGAKEKGRHLFWADSDPLLSLLAEGNYRALAWTYGGHKAADSYDSLLRSLSSYLDGAEASLSKGDAEHFVAALSFASARVPLSRQYQFSHLHAKVYGSLSAYTEEAGYFYLKQYIAQKIAFLDLHLAR